MDFFNLVAREKYNLPEDWEWYKFTSIGVHPKYDAVQLTGAVAPLKTRGKYAGRRNWAKRDRASEASVVITDAEIKAFQLRYEQENLRCYVCDGNGQEWYGWSATDGSRFRKCSRCEGTGKPMGAA